jgi:hypothetical protein
MKYVRTISKRARFRNYVKKWKMGNTKTSQHKKISGQLELPWPAPKFTQLKNTPRRWKETKLPWKPSVFIKKQYPQEKELSQQKITNYFSFGSI